MPSSGVELRVESSNFTTSLFIHIAQLCPSVDVSIDRPLDFQRMQLR